MTKKILDISYYSAHFFPQGLFAASDSFLIATFLRPAMPQVSSSKLLYFKSPAVTLLISNIPTGRPPSRWVILISKGVVLRLLRGKMQQQLLCIILVGGKKHKALLSAKFLSSKTDISFQKWWKLQTLTLTKTLLEVPESWKPLGLCHDVQKREAAILDLLLSGQKAMLCCKLLGPWTVHSCVIFWQLSPFPQNHWQQLH